MGRLFLLEFDQSPDNQFYLCHTCQTHIAKTEEFQYNFSDNELKGGIFENIVNVHSEGPEKDRKVGARTVRDVHCNKCCDLLGIKFVEVADDDTILGHECYLLYLTKLLLWNGSDMVDAEAQAE